VTAITPWAAVWLTTLCHPVRTTLTLLLLRAAEMSRTIAAAFMTRSFVVIHGLIGMHGWTMTFAARVTLLAVLTLHVRTGAFMTAFSIRTPAHLGALLLIGAFMTTIIRTMLFRAAWCVWTRTFRACTVGLSTFARWLDLAGLFTRRAGRAIGFAILLGKGGETHGGQEASDEHQGVESGFHGCAWFAG
jgi:hypothetical protein